MFDLIKYPWDPDFIAGQRRIADMPMSSNPILPEFVDFWTDLIKSYTSDEFGEIYESGEYERILREKYIQLTLEHNK